MAEIFNVDLPPRFLFKPGTDEEMNKELEDYLERLSSSVDEMLKRVFNRLDLKDLWEIDGTEHQLVTADEVDMQSKKIINLTDPSNAQDAATKASQDAAATAASLWEVDGGEHQLKTADEIDMQTKKIINVVDPTSNQEAATKKFHDDDMNAEMNTSTGHDHDGSNSKKVDYDDLVNAPSAANTSNVIFSWSGVDNRDANGRIGGLFIGDTLLPDIVNGGAEDSEAFNMILVTDQIASARTLLNFQFTKIAGISTVTIHARIWAEGTGSNAEAILTVNIGGQSNTVKSVTSLTPTWVTVATIDVSGLSNGVVYDGIVGLHNEDAARASFCSAVTLIAS